MRFKSACETQHYYAIIPKSGLEPFDTSKGGECWTSDAIPESGLEPFDILLSLKFHLQ